MKSTNTPAAGLGEENTVVDLNEMIFLLIGKDVESQQAFRNEVLEHAEKLRNGFKARSGKQALRIFEPIMEFPQSA